MGQPYVGEIRMFAGNFAPVGFQLCDGQLYPISGNEVLYQLIGTTYGGDGVTTFGVPDLRGRVPIHQGQGAGLQPYTLGQLAGQESVTLTVNQLPGHTHLMAAQGGPATSASPAGKVLAEGSKRVYRPASSLAATVPTTSAGGGQPHENMAPFLAVTFIIAFFGVFPSPS